MEGKRVSHYEIVRLLGRGGMGEVYEAVDLHLDRRPVALKFIAPELARVPESLGRFEREAASAARLKHPNIATVHAFVREGALPFIDMELLGGPSLRARIEHGPLPLGEALAIARDVAAALAHAHRRGVIHRDIKPENLMFDDGVVKVTDFGLARAAQASKLTMTGTALGTAAYMAPETVRGEAQAASDVFALGVVLYEMLCRAMPFAGDQPLALMYAIANQPPVPLAERGVSVPPEVEALLLRLLEKDPARRPDAATAARELAALAGGGPRFDPVTEELEVVRVQDTGAITVPLPVPGALAKTPRPRPRRGRAAAVMIGLFGTVGIAVSLLVMLSGQRARGRADAVALNNQGFEALRGGATDSARALFVGALARDPGYAPARLNLAGALHALDRDDEAAREIARLLARRDLPAADAAQARSLMADLEAKVSNFDEASRQLRAAIALAPDQRVYPNNLGWALIRAGRFAEAHGVLDSALARFPDDPFLLKNDGLALVRLGRLAEARARLDRAIQLDPTLASPWGVRSLARSLAADAAGAAADWREYLAREPDAAERAGLEADLQRAAAGSR